MSDIPYEFIIDTDSYAGNFERELCAYVTGIWDEDTHGGDQAKVFKEEVGTFNPFESYITFEVEEGQFQPQHLEFEPVSKSMNSVSILFDREPTNELVILMKERSYKFSKQGVVFNKPVKLKIIGFRLLKRVVTINIVSI